MWNTLFWIATITRESLQKLVEISRTPGRISLIRYLASIALNIQDLDLCLNDFCFSVFWLCSIRLWTRLVVCRSISIPRRAFWSRSILMSGYLVHSSDSAAWWVCFHSVFFQYLSQAKLEIVQLLHKLSIRGVNGPEKLLKVIKVQYIMFNSFLSYRLNLSSDP